jgi:hypothetical protein
MGHVAASGSTSWKRWARDQSERRWAGSSLIGLSEVARSLAIDVQVNGQVREE